jgi:hypothetical protein
MNQRMRAIFATTVVWMLPSAAILTVLWLPFGFSMIGLIEEWDLLGLFAMHGTFLFTHFDGPLAAHSLRPLMPLSFAVAHLIDPNSFAGWHLVTLASLLLKGGAMTYLVARGTGSREWGVVAAALILLYPADTMQLSFRSIHINAAIALALVGAALQVRCFDIRGSARAGAMALCASLLYLTAIFIYEVALTLVALPFVIAVVRQGWRRLLLPPGSRWALALPWLASVGLYLSYAALRSASIASYQGQVTGDKQALIAGAYAALPKLFTIGAARAFAGGWLDAARMTAKEYESWLYLGCAVWGIAIVVLFAVRIGSLIRTADDEAVQRGLPVRLIVLGIVLVLMGYAPYLTSPAHMAISQRTFLWTAPGAAIAWVGILMMLWRLARVPSVLVALLLLLVGLGAQLFQFHHYVELSARQRTLLRAIVENLDSKEVAQKTVLVLDGTDQVGHTWLFPGDELHYVLSYLYGRKVGPVEICRSGRMEWQRADALNRKGVCARDGTDWVFAFPPSGGGPGVPPIASQAVRRLPREQVSVVSLETIGETQSEAVVVANRRHQLQTGMDLIDRRYRGILAPRPPSPIAPMFRDQFVGLRYRWSFGDWWNLDVPPRGAGWREAEWAGNGLKQRSGAWKIDRAADLHFELKPQAGTYIVRGHFEQFASDAVRNSIRLRMNDRLLPLAWASHFDFQAVVPAETLVRGTNNLEFESDSDNSYYGLSAFLDWVEVKPWPPR